jgi:guanosine-3',5'-bis(diphosphate) 3'-pyrophosphohydrolase
MDEELKILISKVRSYNPNPNLKLVKSAWEFAKKAHDGQVRASGDPTITHPLAVSNILADWKLDSVSIAAGFLHDTIEDCGVTKQQLKKEFGEEVAELVDGVTKIGEIKLREKKEEEFVENLRKMLLVMAKDLRVVFLRLADRLHNMRTLQYLPEEKQVRIARETLEVFAPLAERLGIGEAKGELEDLAFTYVYPEEYKKVKKLAKPYYKKIETNIKKMKKSLLKRLSKEDVHVHIQSRKKHIYSLWKKLQRPGVDWDFDKVHDIIALRIITSTVRECYVALGILNKLYKPVQKIKMSDFIAHPKPNGYRSIHIKVFGPGDKIVEVQIRTEQMHEEDENGLAAHWHYSLMKSGKAKEKKIERGFFAPTEKIKWVKQLVEWQKSETDTEEFVKAVKFDALSSRIFVFSPKGDVYDLPMNATPVDYAYRVHTELGNYIKQVKVNGKVVSLDRKLNNADVVEIAKTKNPKQPSRDWLRFVKTTLAKREINKELRKKA